MNRIALVTGTSTGIGLAAAQELLRRGWRVVGISRRAAPIDHRHYSHLRLDLAETAALVASVDAHAGPLVSDPSVGRIALINNAALGGLLGPVEQLDVAALPTIFAVNVTAPIALLGWLLRRSPHAAPLRIVNVSSGAAVIAYPGLGAYGSSKAALRMAGMILGVELDDAVKRGEAARDVSILSFQPSMVDTPMQADARASSYSVLPMVDYFKQAFEEGRLLPPAAPATAMADYVDADGHPRFSESRLQPS